MRPCSIDKRRPVGVLSAARQILSAKLTRVRALKRELGERGTSGATIEVYELDERCL
jgi:hypothetical protein